MPKSKTEEGGRRGAIGYILTTISRKLYRGPHLLPKRKGVCLFPALQGNEAIWCLTYRRKNRVVLHLAGGEEKVKFLPPYDETSRGEGKGPRDLSGVGWLGDVSKTTIRW